MQCQEEVKSMLMVLASQQKLSAYTEWYCNMGILKNEQPPLKFTFTLFMILNDQTQKLEPQKHDIQY